MCVMKNMGALPHDDMTCANSDQQTLRRKKTKWRMKILKVILTAWNNHTQQTECVSLYVNITATARA